MGLKYILIVLQLISVCGLAEAYENYVYIWQRSWRPEISESINRLAPVSSRFMVLAGDLKVENKRVVFSKVSVKWEYLIHKGKVTIDVRMRANVSNFFKEDDISMAAAYLAKSIDALIEEAKRGGVDVSGIEFDYDCPTGKLKDFARFIKTVRLHLKGKIFSITALPAWLDNPDCPDLIDLVNYYVLQLHSFETPKNIDSRQYIFPDYAALSYLKKAVALQRPFYVSLPTYGYEVVYGKDDEFIGLRAESGLQYYGEGIKRKMVFADPAAIVQFLDAASGVKSNNFIGVCWFRLPVPSDRFNWDIKTFERVIKKEKPRGHLSIEVVKKPDGAKELFLLNDGELNFSEDINFDISWSGKKPLYDVLSGFDYTDLPEGKGLGIAGKAPRVARKKMIAWFRMADASEVNILNSEVRTYEKH